jgi:hypothetical protein
MKHIKIIAKLITEDPDLFNEGWDEVGIEDPFPDEQPTGIKKMEEVEGKLAQEILRHYIIQTARGMAKQQGREWDRLSVEEKKSFLRDAMHFHNEFGIPGDWRGT